MWEKGSLAVAKLPPFQTMANVASPPPSLRLPTLRGCFLSLLPTRRRLFIVSVCFLPYSPPPPPPSCPKIQLEPGMKRQLGHFSCFLCPYKFPHIAFHLQPTMLVELKKAMVQPLIPGVYSQSLPHPIWVSPAPNCCSQMSCRSLMASHGGNR